MVFHPNQFVPSLPDIPRSIPVGQFVLNQPFPTLTESDRHTSLTCAQTGRGYSRDELRARVENISKGLASLLKWPVNDISPWEKVVAVLSVNSIDYMPVCWAVHRLGGICLLLHPTTGVDELARHMQAAKCGTLVTCTSLLNTCDKLKREVGLDDSRIFIMETPPMSSYTETKVSTSPYKSIYEVAETGIRSLEPLVDLNWAPRQGDGQVAFLCATSGTSGRQKLARLTHVNFIANILQATALEDVHRKGRPEIASAFLPLSHSYGLILAHCMVFRGDGAIVFPEFDMPNFLTAIGKFRIERLYLIPPITAALVANKFLFDMFDVSSVRSIVSGAAPFSTELNEKIKAVMPTWQILPGYGLTESCVIASVTTPEDEFPGSSGVLVPGFEARLLDEAGNDIEEMGKSGELLLRSPSVIKGYLDDPEADQASLTAGGWLRTGDVGLFKMSTRGIQHLFVIDRLKDMIKVKGLQVAPTDIEASLLNYPAVAEAAVIGVADERAGERPKAFIVRSPKVMSNSTEEELKAAIEQHVCEHMTESHWLHDRIVLVADLPRGATKKVLKTKLRQMG